MKFLNLRLAAASVIAGYRSAGAEGSLEKRRFFGGGRGFLANS
jgi:hypothetical protein